MSLAGTERRRHLITAVIGTVLMLFMGTVLLLGFRFATQMRTNITALQTASTLQTGREVRKVRLERPGVLAREQLRALHRGVVLATLA